MKALREFYRVLKPGGSCFIEVPNLEGILPDDTVIYTTPQGLQIRGIDMYFGYREASYKNHWMMHKCGFMAKTLEPALAHAGFRSKVLAAGCDLLGIGVKPE